MADFVTLSCPSCRGRLEITQDIERFACAHCGREHVVKRSGGIVSLSPVIDAIRKVEIGVDKTAAELAIVLLQKEIADVRGRRDSLLASSPRPQINPMYILLIFTGAVLAYVAIGGASVTGFASGIVIVLIGLVPFFIHPSRTKNWDTTVGAQLKSIERELAAKYSELQSDKTIVSR